MNLEVDILFFILFGFVAQIIDGALGMAYGVSSNTLLLSLGIEPKFASAGVHMAEVITTGVSGFSHWRVGNLDWSLIKRLAIPGVLGGVTGAYVLANIDGNVIKPYVSAYLLIMGVVILVKALQKNQVLRQMFSTLFIIPLGLLGGFMDAIGGGGWGPVVTTTLVARGKEPRFAIGSVNFSEFFVTFGESVTFLLTIKQLASLWPIILGLLIGGVLAAPLAAIIAKRLPSRLLMGLVGVLIIVLSIRTLVQIFWGVDIFAP